MNAEENKKIIQSVLDKAPKEADSKIIVWAVIQTLKIIQSQPKQLSDEEIEDKSYSFADELDGTSFESIVDTLESAMKWVRDRTNETAGDTGGGVDKLTWTEAKEVYMKFHRMDEYSENMSIDIDFAVWLVNNYLTQRNQQNEK